MSTADLTDEQLGREALRGDREAFAELFGRHESGLYNVAYRLTGDREDAADITQEAFLRVFARLDDLAGREVNLPAYLHRTARNLVYDRSAARARETPVDEIAGAAGADEGMEADPQLTALVSAQGEAVRAANARLPERHRLVLALRELEDMSYEDIGRVLDVTPGAVAQLLGRARMALRRELRLQQVDAGRMDPACRARLGAIGAMIDGELDPDRSQVLTRHLAECPSCREARAAFEEARVTYRAWLPLPVLLGLGAETARAAEARGLVRFDDAGGGGDGDGGTGSGRGPGAGGILGSRRRIAVASLALLLLVGASTVVGVRSAGDAPAPETPAAAVAAAGSTTTAPAGTTAPGPTTAAAAPTSTSAAVAAPPPVPGASAATATVERSAEATTARARTRTARPSVTAAGGPVATVAPPVSTQAPPTTDAAPRPDPPVTAGGSTTREPGPNDPAPCVPGTACNPSDPPPTTTRREPVPPPPVTTIRVPPVITIAPPVR